MSLGTIININVDFYKKKYIMINAKQYDSSSRWIAITCYNQGDIFTLNANEHTAYIRYKKSDGYGVLNTCRINSKGEVLVELTEQMLASDGICYVDLMVVNKGSAIINVDTGEIITVDNSPILSTMAFCIDVHESAISNFAIESSYEFNALNEALQKAEADYTEVIQLAKSYAIGDANGIRENEDTDNSKYYSEQAKSCSDQSVINAENAANSEQNAESYMNNAKAYMDDAKASKDTAAVSEINAKASETNSKTSEINSKSSETNAKTSESNALISEQNAKVSETSSLNNANFAKSYAVGATGTRDGEDNDNVKYYYELVKNIVVGLDVAAVDEVKDYLRI